MPATCRGLDRVGGEGSAPLVGQARWAWHSPKEPSRARKAGFLTRHRRAIERKKYGLKKAREAHLAVALLHLRSGEGDAVSAPSMMPDLGAAWGFEESTEGICCV